MSLIEEQFSSREFTQGADGMTLRRVYHVYVNDPVEAASYGPQRGEQYLGDGGGSADLYPIFVDSISTRPLEAQDCIELIVEYKSLKSTTPVLNQEVWTTDGTGDNVHIEAVDASYWRTRYVDDETLFDREVGLSIGKKQDGTIDGVDVMLPIVTMSCTTWKTVAEVTDDYKRVLYFMIGMVNDQPFREWEAGEVRFDGVSIEEIQGENLVKLVFKFSCRSNQTGLSFTIVPTIEAGTVYREDITVSVDKDGWQYLWKQIGDVATYNGVNQPTKERKAATIAIVVDDVYKYTDFADLGLLPTA